MIPFSLSKIARSQVQACLLIIVIVPIFCIGSVSVSLAAKDDCDTLLSEQSYKNLDGAKIIEIQKQLRQKGYDPVKIDGRIGELTLAALKQYCTAIQFNATEDFAGNVIAALLDPAAHRQTGQAKTSVEDIVSYKLTEDDFKDLKTAGENIEKLKEIQNIAYENEKDFLTAVQSKIPDLSKKNQSLILKYAEKPWIYRLSQKSLDNLKKKNIPEAILDRLQKIKDKKYQNKNLLTKEVRAQIKDTANQYPLLTVRGSGQFSEAPEEVQPLDELRKNNVPDDIIKLLSELKNLTYYPSKKEFEAVVDNKIKEVAQKYNRYPPLIATEAEERVTYRLDDQSFKELQSQGIPDDILEKLQGLQNKPYADKNDLDRAIAENIRAETAKYLPLILKHSRFLIISNRLSGSAFNELKVENVPDDLLDELQVIKSSWYLNNWYFSKKNFTAKVKKIVVEKTNHYIFQVSVYAGETRTYQLSTYAIEKLRNQKVPDDILNKVQELKDEEFSSRDALKAAAAAKIRESVDQYKSVVAAYIEDVFKSSEKSYGNLKDKDVPDTILDQVQAAKDKKDDDKNIPIDKLKAIINVSEDLYPPLIVKEAEALEAYELTEKSIEKLSAEIISDGTLLEKLSQLQNIEYANETLIENALEHIGITDKNQQALIVTQAEQRHAYEDENHRSIEWNSGSCGCVLEDLSGVVYGFYPFWMAGKPQELDFSVLSRIGYYALSFNQDGAITRPINWRPDKAGFIKMAQKYRTDVDLVIYKNWNDWNEWRDITDSRKSYILEELKTNIVKLAHLKLQDIFSRIKPLLSMGTSPIPTMSNGVTIYFDGYPPNSDSDKFLFLKFIKDLRTSLKALRKDYTLNIMLDMNAIGIGVYDSDSLKKIIPHIEKGANGYEEQNIVDHFLVFIEEPTKKTKKDLRNKVEELFTGIHRRTMLRKIIPIITPTENNKQQLGDDLIYFEDNFGGVGFWTLPIKEGSGVAFLTCAKEILSIASAQAEEEPRTDKEKPPLADYVNADLQQLYRKHGARPVSGYRKFVTLHRWGGRILFDIMLAIIAVYALLAKFFCSFRDLFRRFFWWFMAFIFLFVGVFFSLLYFDPAWKNLARGNLILLLFILVITLISVLKYVKRSRRGEAP